PFGLAVDLGTTKIAAYLIDLENGNTLASEGIDNPQIPYGEDVITRISYAMEHDGIRLQQAVIDGLNSLIEKLCPEPEWIVEMTLVGNTAMHHLFLGLPVKQLGVAPYLPVVQGSLDVKARDIGLNTAPGAYVHLLPNVAGFIGADHTAMILATGIYKTDKTVLGLDIGTNTEVVLAHRGRLMSTSCASGPAFEGGHISWGMRATKGAIEKVAIGESHVAVQTIDNVLPIGLCGSGVLDAVAELYRTGLITRQGRLVSGSGVRQAGTEREFVLVSADKSGTGKEITLTQKDISEVQLAKAAVRTGIEALLSEMNITWEEIEEVVIAGGFGAAINPSSAIAIGMFPHLHLERFRDAGNAAGTGARLALISRPQREKAEEIARRISYLELMTKPDFSIQFSRALFFPDK
ncbi:MAG: ASKHA domain-containing protein, partial [Proteobacteria bacterium]|nr:ASKHA domain-containing protein [Pseudomonadota bacterium]